MTSLKAALNYVDDSRDNQPEEFDDIPKEEARMKLKISKPVAKPVQPKLVLSKPKPVKPAPKPDASTSANIISGAAPLPKGAVFASDANINELYTNYEKEPRMCRVVKKLPATPKTAPKVVLMVWIESTSEWREIDVPFNYPLEPSLERLPKSRNPKLKEASHMAKKQAAAAHLKSHQFKKGQARDVTPPVVLKKNGKACTAMKLGDNRCLFDAGDASFICKLKADDSPMEVANGRKLRLLKYAELDKDVLVTLRKKWAEAKAKKA